MAISTEKKVVLTSAAPQPIGPYSQAVSFGNLLFCSGQIPLDPISGQVVGSDIQTQAHRVLESMKAVVEAGGSNLGRVMKTTIFLKDMGDFPKVNEVYAQFFTSNPPARSTVEVARLPKDVLVEIECVAALE